MLNRFLRVSVVAIVLMSSTVSFAAGNRSAKKVGLHLGLVGDPFPTLVGLNLNYNLSGYMRLVAGYGTISTSGTSTTSTYEMKATMPVYSTVTFA